MLQLISLQCFPCIDYFKILVQHTHVELDIYEHFRKTSFRNRYVVSGANGLIHLTIPIAGGREQKRVVTEVDIDNTGDWRIKHWRTLVSCYRKAPFFDYYSGDIQEMIFNTEKSLFSFNYSILDKLVKLLNINLEISYSSFDEMGRKVDYKTLSPVSFQDNANSWTPKYAQVFDDRLGFQPNLSILDLLFCQGPGSKRLLEESIKCGL